MASNGTGPRGGSALTFVDDSTDGFSLFGPVAHLQPVGEVVGDSAASVGWAQATMARVEREIDHLWRDSMNADDRAMSHRFAEVSHALQRAARLLEHDNTIG
jgi:hypothetical protein